MEQKKAADKIVDAFHAGLFAQSAKYIRFTRYYGLDIREQSQRNYRALLDRLDQRAHLPDDEKAQYGTGRLSSIEASFFRYWCQVILPLFTARHGTSHFAYIQNSGYLMPVADRRRTSALHQNSRTSGFARQEYTYCVLGIGPSHPVPVSVANSKTITLHFDRMTADEKRQFSGMFISGHETDYNRDITYPIIVCGNTDYKVSYDKSSKLRTSTFKRSDGTVITESLRFEDEIIVADPSVDVIFEWLGYKVIEYLRFIGGEFQQDILICNNVDKIAAFFHTVFPSYRFPELKIAVKKIPITAAYVEVNFTNEVDHKEVSAFYRSCNDFDFLNLKTLINPTLVNVPYGDEKSPLSSMLKNYHSVPEALQVVELLLDNNADVNMGTYIDTNLSRAITLGDLNLMRLLIRGNASPYCSALRTLPKVDRAALKAIIQLHNLSLFEQYFPLYLEYASAQALLNDACLGVLESLPSYQKAEGRLGAQDTYDNSHSILERVLADCNPNCDDVEEKPFCSAARDGKLRVVRAFLRHPKLEIDQKNASKSRNVSDFEDWTALHFACWKGRFEIVNELLSAGSNVNAVSHTGRTPLAVVEDVLSGALDFMSKHERQSDALTSNNLMRMFGRGLTEKKLSTEEQKNYSAIITILKSKGANRDFQAELEKKPLASNIAVVACVTARYQDETFVILVRKSNAFDQGQGNYLFPGGFYDPHRDQFDLSATAIREVAEETGVNIALAYCKKSAVYDKTIDAVQLKRHFYHFDLGNVNRLPFCRPNSDVAEATWVNTNKIKCAQYNDELAMSFNSIALKYSNALILSAIMNNELPDDKLIIASQYAEFEQSLNQVVSALYFVFQLGNIYDMRDQALDVFSQLRQKIPTGFLQSCYDELLESLNQTDLEEKAIACVQNMVTHVVMTGRLHIDELQFNNVPMLHLASQASNAREVAWLLDLGANVNAQFGKLLNAYTPLSCCITLNDLDTARLLIERYEAAIIMSDVTDSALTVASSLPMIPDAFIEYLIDKCPVFTDEQLGTVLHELIRTRRCSLLDKLLTEYTIDLNRQYVRRQSLSTDSYLMLTAINICCLETVKILVKHGADASLEYKSGSSFVTFSMFMHRDLLSRRREIIAYLPSHPLHEENANYFGFMRSLSECKDSSEEDLKQKLSLIEENLTELDQITGLLKSYQPSDQLLKGLGYTVLL